MTRKELIKKLKRALNVIDSADANLGLAQDILIYAKQETLAEDIQQIINQIHNLGIKNLITALHKLEKQ